MPDLKHRLTDRREPIGSLSRCQSGRLPGRMADLTARAVAQGKAGALGQNRTLPTPGAGQTMTTVTLGGLLPKHPQP